MSNLLICVVVVAAVGVALLLNLVDIPYTPSTPIIIPTVTPVINTSTPTLPSCVGNTVSPEPLPKTLTGHSRLVYAVALSPDGQFLASGSYEEVKLWDLRNADKLNTEQEQQHTRLVKKESEGDLGSVGSLAISNTNGKILVAGGGWGKGVIPIWRLFEKELSGNSEKEDQRLKRHANNIKALTISPDAQTLVSGSFEEIKIWDVSNNQANNKKIIDRDLKGSGYVTSLAISPSPEDGNILVSGSEDGKIRTWYLDNIGNPDAPKAKFTLSANSKNPVRSLAISRNSPIGEVIISGYDDGIINIWNLNTGERLHSFSSQSRSVRSLTISANGKLLAIGTGDGKVKVWNLINLDPSKPNLTCNHLPDYVDDELIILNMLQDKQLLVIGYGFKVIKIWQMPL